MRRMTCVALFLITAGAIAAAFAAEPPVDPDAARAAREAADRQRTLKLYKDLLIQVQNRPGDRALLLALQPPSNVRDRRQRALLGEMVDWLAASARKKPADFAIGRNYYTVLWARYTYYGAVADGVRALAQLAAITKLTKPNTVPRAGCEFERAMKILGAKKEHAGQLAGGDPAAVAIGLLIQAKRSAMSKGAYARGAALELGNLYKAKGDVKKARESYREAIRLDPGRGYVTNRAYDALGQLLIAERQPSRALTLLESAGAVSPDAGIRAFGFASKLATLLTNAGKSKQALAYLQKAYDASIESKSTLDPNLVYALALSYEKLGKTGPAILYYKRYLDLRGSDPRQRQKAKATVERLVTAGLD